MSNRALESGSVAPDFALKSTPDQVVKLSDFRGQPVVLVFYPADWSPVCGDQLALYNELLPEFKKFNAAIIGISVDGIWSHVAFSHDRGYRFPLLSDFEPKGGVAKAYGVYRDEEGHSERALFVIDSEGVITWSHVAPIGVNPGADGILAALESLDGSEVGSGLSLPVGERDHVWGPASAPVTLVEYGDYECPHCGAAHPIVKKLLSEAGDSVRFVFRNFPLTEVHRHAEKAAEAAEVAADLGAFWALHDLIFENQEHLDINSLAEYASRAGLDKSVFLSHLVGGAKLERVKEDFMSGVRSGVNGTPTFFINGRRHDGGYSLSELKAAIQGAHK